MKSLGFLAALQVACGGAAQEAKPPEAQSPGVSTADTDAKGEPRPANPQSDEQEPGLVASAKPAGDGDCANACSQLSQCDATTATECVQRCSASRLKGHQRCLALRILLINEDGCDAMLKSYRGFDANDDCTGPQFPFADDQAAAEDFPAKRNWVSPR